MIWKIVKLIKKEKKISADNNKKIELTVSSKKDNSSDILDSSDVSSDIIPKRKNRKKKKSDSSDASENEFEVERIVEEKIEKGKTLFHIKWKGWGSEHNTWEPKEHLSEITLKNWTKEKK